MIVTIAYILPYLKEALAVLFLLWFIYIMTRNGRDDDDRAGILS